MSFLKAEGFDRLLAGVAEQARDCSLVEDAVKIALTLGGTVPESVGRAALTSAERIVLDAMLEHGAGLAPGNDGRELLTLTRTGRLMVLSGGSSCPEGAHSIGSAVWPAIGPRSEVDARRAFAVQEETRRHEELRRWLSAEPAERIRVRLDRITHALVHMAPVLLYVGSRTYSNLGNLGNLPGKTITAGSSEDLLAILAGTPVERWLPEDACFVACLNGLLLSGPPVRAEEFNGVQLGPVTLEEFLKGRITAYGGVPPRRGEQRLGEWLDRLAVACGRSRAEAQEHGVRFYRVINGVSLHKRESVMEHAIGPPDTPPAVARFLEETGPVPELLTAPAPKGFSSAYEGFLHEFLRTVARSLDADVAMARGPRNLRRLLGDPLSLRTGDFYCCVVAGAPFAERFGADRPALARALSAYGARMRFNTWHYLPDTLEVPDRDSTRDDWFFAPAMPDITKWSDQHHTGHVTFGVRYAIRVPLGVTFEGRNRPGLYDLRLMRAQEPAFNLGHLRAAVAVGQLLGDLHQEMASHDPDITDFANEWYRTFHG